MVILAFAFNPMKDLFHSQEGRHLRPPSDRKVNGVANSTGFIPT